jgi:hypothetical protein
MPALVLNSVNKTIELSSRQIINVTTGGTSPGPSGNAIEWENTVSQSVAVKWETL